IREEFSQAIKMLKTQADGLGMAVREKDVQAVKTLLYHKALMMGRCVDKAITSRKMASAPEKVIVEKSVERCVGEHRKFVTWLETAKRTENLRKCEYRAHVSGLNDPYDFLELDHPPRLDYLAFWECYRPCLVSEKVDVGSLKTKADV